MMTGKALRPTTKENVVSNARRQGFNFPCRVLELSIDNLGSLGTNGSLVASASAAGSKTVLAVKSAPGGHSGSQKSDDDELLDHFCEYRNE